MIDGTDREIRVGAGMIEIEIDRAVREILVETGTVMCPVPDHFFFSDGWRYNPLR
jgi:hypothetical protein